MENRRSKFFKADGSPKYVRCYEIKRKPMFDKYTVVFTRASCFMGKDFIGRVYYIGSDGHPSHPQGMYQHGEAERGKFCAGGSVIPFFDMPKDLQDTVLEEYRSLWDI